MIFVELISLASVIYLLIRIDEKLDYLIKKNKLDELKGVSDGFDR